ncbi:MAG: EamA-like transporter family [Bacteroidetes bacterium]|nr:MAG: EamA-like transporter family [Bacteroidota bacterium]
MIFLLLAIVCNALLFLVLKYFERFGINTLQGIVVNYFVAGSLGILLTKTDYTFPSLFQNEWYWVPPVLGSLFISIFFLLARTAQTIGVSVASVANKMSFIIPVAAAVLLYGDPLGGMKITGIIVALAAVYMTSKKENGGHGKGFSVFLLPAVVFIGSGIIDALVNYTQQKLLGENEASLFIALSFLVAFVIGTLIVTGNILLGKTKFQSKAILGGIVLGLPNYFSIWCLVEALETGQYQSSVLYPVANMGIVLVSAIGALILFREKLSAFNWAGIGLSLAATLLIMFS